MRASGISCRHGVIGGGTRAMVSNELRHNLLNYEYLTLSSPRLFDDMTATATVKFQADC